MFEYFPDNYVWNLSVVATLNSGGLIDEVDRACRPIRDAAQRGEDAGTREFLSAWQSVAQQLEDSARADLAEGHRRTSGQKLQRAANYLAQAERMQAAGSVQRIETYRHLLEIQVESLALVDPLTSRVEIPFGGSNLPAYFSKAPGDAPAPTMIMFNGLDSTKEHMVASGFHHELAARGISTLMVDCPGSGEALRLRDLKAQIETEVWATACIDWLQTRADVNERLIGLVGWSLGGYYAPRAAAYEKRLALVVAWGANHDWGAVQRARVRREGERPVPHYWEHVLWVWGYDDMDSFLEMADGVNLDGVVENITVPFLVVHGQGDRQIPLEMAHRSYEQAVNSPKRELRIFTPEEGATEHIGLDHLPWCRDFIADWVEDTFHELAERHDLA
jgi:dienelactone hydrolase